MADSFAGMHSDQKFMLLRKELTAAQQRIDQVATALADMKNHVKLIERRLDSAGGKS